MFEAVGQWQAVVKTTPTGAYNTAQALCVSLSLQSSFTIIVLAALQGVQFPKPFRVGWVRYCGLDRQPVMEQR